MTKRNDVKALGAWQDNGALIEALVRLGYLRKEWMTLDPTWGRGTWWKYWAPDTLVTHDLKLDGVDFRKLPHADGEFDVVAFDPPYKLNGTATPEVDERYGVEEYMGWSVRHDLIREGIDECLRVLRPAGILLVKCQAQVSGGKVRWQPREFATYAEWGFGSPGEVDTTTESAPIEQRATQLDMFQMAGGRAQPDDAPEQVTARQNYSTMLVIQKAKPRRRRKGAVE